MHFDTLNIQNLVHNYWKSSMFCSPFPWQRCSQEIHPRQGNIAWGLSLAAIWVIPNNRRFLLRGKKSPPVASTLHRKNLKTKNGVFILKTHQILAKKTNKQNTHAANNGHFGLVWGKLEQGNHVIIVTSSFCKAPFFKMSSDRNAIRCFHIHSVWRAFSKSSVFVTDYSLVKMVGLTVKLKLPFSNLSSVV